MKYEAKSFTVPASAGKPETCAQVGHTEPDQRGKCLRCGAQIAHMAIPCNACHGKGWVSRPRRTRIPCKHACACSGACSFERVRCICKNAKGLRLPPNRRESPPRALGVR